MKTISIVFVFLLLTLFPAIGKITMPNLFSDNMVLQRDQPIHIWGWADSQENIEIKFKEQKVNLKASKDGSWSTYLKTSAYGGPYTLSVKGKDSEHIFQNILVGDVWVCSGQSNMEFQVKNVNNASTEVANSDFPNIRLFTVGRSMANHPQKDVEGTWQVCSPSSVPDFSAVGYFFGRDIYKNTSIPLGLISSSWGGTVAETWTSTESISKVPEFMEKVKTLDKLDIDKLQKTNKENKLLFEKALQNDPGITEKWFLGNIGFEKTMSVPDDWINTDLSDLDGSVWFKYEFFLPEDIGSTAGILSLGKIDDADISWVNGIKVGQTNGYMIDRVYNLEEGVLKPGKNNIVVNVVDYARSGGINGPKDVLFIKVGDKKYPLSGNWNYKIAVDSRDCGLVDFGPNTYPSLLYNGMIAPLIKYPVRGVIWYQGESNDYNPSLYKTLFPNLVQDWREKWDMPLPFYWVQLANFRQPDEIPADSRWAEVREAQTKTLSLPFTGQAVTIDVGEANDIHPRDKQTVGERLALLALKNDYGKPETIASGPTFKSLVKKEGKFVITFDNLGGGLVVRNKYRYINGFAVAGFDKKFVWAKAEVAGNTIVVYSNQVVDPQFVRYAWGDNPDDVNLYNKEELPACPFRYPD